MARPKKKTKRDNVVHVRLSDSEKKEIEKLSASHHLDTLNMIRHLLFFGREKADDSNKK